MIRADQVGVAEDEWDRARFLHQNYLEKKNEEPSKAGEHLWGATNKLASAIHRLETGTGITKHQLVLSYLSDIARESDELTEEQVDSLEDLHGNYYHDHLSEPRLHRELDQASYVYDYLNSMLGQMLEDVDGVEG